MLIINKIEFEVALLMEYLEKILIGKLVVQVQRMSLMILDQVRNKCGFQRWNVPNAVWINLSETEVELRNNHVMNCNRKSTEILFDHIRKLSLHRSAAVVRGTVILTQLKIIPTQTL